MVVYLYEVLSDVNGLVELTPHDSEVDGDGTGGQGEGEHPIKWLRSLVVRTAQKIRESWIRLVLLPQPTRQ